MPTTIVTRAGKGTTLTHAEVDANFTNLQTTADAALPAAGGAVGPIDVTGSVAGLLTAVNLRNNSTGAVGGKNVEANIQGRDTVNTLKTMAKIVSVPTDQDLISADLDIYARGGDVVFRGLSIKWTGDVYARTGTTSMTGGFFCIPGASGAPSGTPTPVGGTYPMYYDSTNNRLYIYNGSWRSVAVT